MGWPLHPPSRSILSFRMLHQAYVRHFLQLRGCRCIRREQLIQEAIRLCLIEETAAVGVAEQFVAEGHALCIAGVQEESALVRRRRRRYLRKEPDEGA